MRGLLGVEPDAAASELHWTPHLPPDWSGVTIRNLKVGASTLTLSLTQTEGAADLKVEDRGPGVRLVFAPEIPLGSQNLRALVNGRPAPASIRAVGQDAEAEVTFRAEPNGAESNTEVELRFESGVRPWVEPGPLVTGARSSGLRVLDSKLQGHTYSAHLDGRPDACSPFSIFTPWRAEHVQGGKIEGHEGHKWKFVASPRPDSCSEASPARDVSDARYETWTLQIEFTP